MPSDGYAKKFLKNNYKKLCLNARKSCCWKIPSKILMHKIKNNFLLEK